MRSCGLLLALIILAIAGFSLVFFNLFSFSFNIGDWLFYFIAAIIVYFIVWAVGASLNKKFENILKKFISGEKESLSISNTLLRTYGFLLITLSPFLIYLMLFALDSAITLAVYGFWLMSGASRIPVIIPIALIIIVVGSAVAIVVGFYYLFFPPRKKPVGIELTENDEPELWKLSKEVAKKVGSKPVSKIVATPFPGIGVYLNGNFLATLFGGGERILEIGFSSIYDLEIDEFSAILAHEYGHFSNRDTQWGSFTYSMGNSLIATLRSMPGPSEQSSEGGLAAALSYNPAYWILYLFVSLFFKITGGFSRIREVLADKRSFDLFGGKTFCSGLNKVALNDAVFYEIIENQYVPELLKSNQVFTSFSKAMEIAYGSPNKEEIKRLSNKLMDIAEEEKFNTHPALKIRVAYAEKFDNPETINDNRSMEKLFSNWDTKNQEVTSIYNYILMAKAGLLNNDGTIREDQTASDEAKNDKR